MVAIRVRKGRIGARGKRGLVMSINPTMAQDLGLKAGENVSIYRATMGGLQVVILANSDEPMLRDDHSGQGRELAAFCEAHKGAVPDKYEAAR